MKKLFVFVLVVSLLAFAGGAWASDAVSHGTDDLVSHGSSGSSSSVAAAPSAADFLSAAKTVSTTVANALTASADYGTGDTYSRDIISGDAIVSMDSTASSNLDGISLPSGSAKYKFPKLSFDTGAYTAGHVLQIVMPQSMSLSGVQKLHFYHNLAAGTAEASKGMWFIYPTVSSGKVVWTKLTPSSTSADIAKSVGNLLVLEFVYQATAPYVNTSATASVNTGAAGEAASSTSGGGLSSSGGGCAVGTSALALAVLGLFIAKRRG